MLNNDLMPPAIVQEIHRTRAELETEAQRLHRLYEKRGAALLETTRDLGEVLTELRDSCNAGEWLPLLGKLEIPRRTASWSIRKFRQDKEGMGNVAHTGQSLEEELADTFAEDEANRGVYQQCNSVEWYTPPHILERVRLYFGGRIPLDPATASHNPTAAHRYFTEEDDGLQQDWRGNGVFVNPPYGEDTSAWCAKIHAEAQKGVVIVALLPCGARFSTEYWQNHILVGDLKAICFVNKRVKFLDEDGEEQASNLYDSAIHGFNVDPDRFSEAFAVLGNVLQISKVATAQRSA
jgi:site-specific DNA-methyltransferase (adenine-specific)